MLDSVEKHSEGYSKVLGRELRSSKETMPDMPVSYITWEYSESRG